MADWRFLGMVVNVAIVLRPEFLRTMALGIIIVYYFAQWMRLGRNLFVISRLNGMTRTV